MTVLRVGVDATSWVNRRGFGRFARNAVGRLVETDLDAEYLLYIDDHALPGGASGARDRRSSTSARLRPSSAAADGSRTFSDLLRLRRAVVADRLDAFLFPSAYTYFPVGRVPTLLGLHDTILDDIPDLTLASRAARAKSRLKHRHRAASGALPLHGLGDVARGARRPPREEPGGLGVVPEAPDADLRAALTPMRSRPGSRRSTSHPRRRFFVYAAGISPHKNVERLVDAYAALARERDDAPLLVLAGELDGAAFLSSAAAVRARIAEHRLEQRVLLPGLRQ